MNKVKASVVPCDFYESSACEAFSRGLSDLRELPLQNAASGYHDDDTGKTLNRNWIWNANVLGQGDNSVS